MSKSDKLLLKRPVCVSYAHPDLAKFRQFAQDFGLKIVQESKDKIHFGGLGPDAYCYVAHQGDKPKFLGASWLVESRSELEKAAKLPSAISGKIEQLDGPGGGEVVTLTDCYGYPCHLVHGIAEKAPTLRSELTLNYPESKPRQGEFQRFETGPALVYKLGHWGYLTPDFQKGKDWYTSTFNLRFSDMQASKLPDGTIMEHSGFIRLDRGDEFVDHHSMFIIGGPPDLPKTAVHHCAFEIGNFDQQVIGHNWLQSKSFELSWGVGRHLLGSQIFDYWLDPTGFRVEHYCDGDILNNETNREPGVHLTPLGQPPEEKDLAIWALQPMTPAFTTIKTWS